MIYLLVSLYSTNQHYGSTGSDIFFKTRRKNVKIMTKFFFRCYSKLTWWEPELSFHCTAASWDFRWGMKPKISDELFHVSDRNVFQTCITARLDSCTFDNRITNSSESLKLNSLYPRYMANTSIAMTFIRVRLRFWESVGKTKKIICNTECKLQA
jgi:hypothetical protein